MTAKEQDTIDKLYSLLSDIKNSNKEFMSKVECEVKTINEKVSKKFTPITLEQDILQTAQQSIQKAILESLVGYSSPLNKLISEVIQNHNQELKEIINNAFESVIRTDEFKTGIREAFSHKVARTIISNQQGLFEKVSNELKQDTLFKSKIAIAVSNVVNECLEERKVK